MGLLLRFRSGLKEEIGIFFPMLVLRVLENVLQPSFLQKMTVLNFLEKICKEPQVIIDIFVNYDCDVDAPNIFERYASFILDEDLCWLIRFICILNFLPNIANSLYKWYNSRCAISTGKIWHSLSNFTAKQFNSIAVHRIVNGLLKTALGVPDGSTTTLTVAQDQTFRIESVKCLATVIKSMGSWMDQQLRIGETLPIISELLSSADNHNIHNGEEGTGMDYDLQSESSSSDVSDSSSLEQRRAYKIELQV